MERTSDDHDPPDPPHRIAAMLFPDNPFPLSLRAV
jgi:hypothetical protein